jgi:hypothetical protein
MSGASLESWRMRRRHGPARRRALRTVIVGESPEAFECARRIAAAGTSEVILSAESPAAAERATLSLVGAARVSVLLDGAAPCDLLIVFGDEPARARDVALWAARTCPLTALILAAQRGLDLSRQTARGSGLAPYLILSPGGMPRARIEAMRLARRLDVSAAQVCVPTVGGDGEGAGSAVPLRRYATVAGVPARQISEADWRLWSEEPAPRITIAARLASIVALANAVIEDRREVLSCGAWIDGAFGLPGAFVTAPVRVGARGAEEPLALKLTLEERSLLQRAADR